MSLGKKEERKRKKAMKRKKVFVGIELTVLPHTGWTITSLRHIHNALRAGTKLKAG